MSDGSKHGGQYQRVVGLRGVELISESLTDVENRLQGSAAGSLRPQVATGRSWLRWGLEGCQRYAEKIYEISAGRSVRRHLPPSVFSVLDESLGFL